jgi:repressor LexA
MEPLTPRQAKILQLVTDAIEANGYPPTRAEICRAMGFSSPNAAEKHLRTLERKGAIRIDGSHRGIRLKTDSGLPLIGRVAAGSPILAEANVQARYRLDPALFKPRADYLLKVRGSSMRDAGILDGDLLAVHATQEARSGQIVVARLHDEVTVKRYKRSGGRIQLLPENPDFKTIEVDPRRDALAIEGVAVGIIRSGRAL